MAKRKTWRDRRCHHGRPPQTRIIYDVIHCEEPGCWREVLASAGLQRIDKKREEAQHQIVDALQELVAACVTDEDTCSVCLHEPAAHASGCAVAKAADRLTALAEVARG